MRRRGSLQPVIVPSASTGRRRRAALGASVAAAAAVALLAASPAQASSTPDKWTTAYGNGGAASTNAGERALTASTAAKVRQAWRATASSESPRAPVVVGGVAYRVAGGTRETFTAVSATTGATKWTLTLPDATYDAGLAISGTTVLVPFTGSSAPSGVLAVDTVRHRVAWRSSLPASHDPQQDAVASDAIAADDRVYVRGADDAVVAYRVSDGKRLWSRPFVSNGNGGIFAVDGLSAGGGLVYTSGDEGVVAFDGATGAQRWRSSSGTAGLPVLAGGRVFTADPTGVVAAWPASGCGASMCKPLWRTTVTEQALEDLEVGSADASHVFVELTTYRSGGPGFDGHVLRLSAKTGAEQWSVTAGQDTHGLISGGGVIWLRDEARNSRDQLQDRILAYATTATGSKPLTTIVLSQDDGGFPQGLAVASGTLFEQTARNGLIGFRAKG